MVLTDFGLFLTMCGSTIVFVIGILGMLMCKKSLIALIISTEVLFLAPIINCVATSLFHGDISGQVLALFILGVSSAEAIVSLSLFLFFRKIYGHALPYKVNKIIG